jgi:hypothetical protein
MSNIDLFGNKEAQKSMTPMQRIATRQPVLTGRDLYTTEPKDVERFILAIQRDKIEIPVPIWEPAAGRGDITKTLWKYGYKPIWSSDIYRYEDEDITVLEGDFFTFQDAGPYKTIITNPPFNEQETFLVHALSMGVDVIFFVRLSFLTSIRRYKIFQQYKPSYVYVYSSRACCYKDGDIANSQRMIDYCMMIWKPPYEADTILRWIA